MDKGEGLSWAGGGGVAFDRSETQETVQGQQPAKEEKACAPGG